MFSLFTVFSVRRHSIWGFFKLLSKEDRIFESIIHIQFLFFFKRNTLTKHKKSKINKITRKKKVLNFA